MENTTKYAPTRLEQMRSELEEILNAYRDVTGTSATFSTFVALGDKKFYRNLHVTDFRVGSFDKALGRLSAVWPDGVEWPAHIPRPAPIEPGEKVREEIAARTQKETADG